MPRSQDGTQEATREGTGDEPPTELTCGQEMSASADVPQTWHDLMDHVAGNMEGHATWVGVDSPAAQQEHDALMRVATEYRAMAAAAARAAIAMRAMNDLPPAPHDPSRSPWRHSPSPHGPQSHRQRPTGDGHPHVEWMRTKIKMQRALAALLASHADDSERALLAESQA